MEGCDLEEALRREAAAVVAGDETAAGRFVGLGLDLIEHAIRNALERSGQGELGWQKVDAIEACDGFLEEKLCTNAEEFCRAMLQYDRVSAALRQSAANWTLSRLRQRGNADIDLDEGRVRDSSRQPEQESALDVLLELEGDSEAAEMRRELWSLSEEDRLLVSVLFVGGAGLSDEDLDAIARRRGIGRERVRAEVLARAERRRAREAELRAERAAVAERRYEQALRLGALEAIRRSERDDPDARPAQGVMLSDYVTRRQMREASPEERAGLLSRRLEYLRSADRMLEKLDRQLGDPGLKQPNYEEVAIIIGRVSTDASEEKRKRAANWVNVRRDRIRRMLTEKIAAKRRRQS